MKTAKKLRHPPEGGYARGDETRSKIIEAALELFDEHGFEHASTRDIAAHAGVNAPALQYYFENKEGVYRACVEVLAEDAWKTFGPAIEHAHEALRANAGTAALIDAFLAIQHAVMERAFATTGTIGQRFFLRDEQPGHEPESATQIIACRIRKPLNDASAALVARISGRAADDPITLIRTLSLFGQIAIFQTTCKPTLASPGRKGMDAARADMIKTILARQAGTLLQHWSRERSAAYAPA